MRKCLHCGYSWPQRFANRKPKACPNCQNYNYDQPRQRAPHKRKQKIENITESNN